MKITVIGYSGSGKSTLTQELAHHYNIAHLHLDTIEFEENWKKRADELSLQMVQNFMEKNQNWIIDGNYRRFYQEERLELSDQIIFMNFNRFNCLWRAYRRYLRYRGKSRESMASGCIEKCDFEFVKWILWEGRTKAIKSRYQDIIHKHSNKIIILHNQRELDRYKKIMKIQKKIEN